MPRGPYRKYLRDVNIPIPRTTLLRRRQQRDQVQEDVARQDEVSRCVYVLIEIVCSTLICLSLT
jgi:hypothetical protein